MCRGCGKVTYREPTLTYGPGVPKGYRTQAEVFVIYHGTQDIRITGCVSGNIYLFAPDYERSIDENDAVCIVELDGFEYV